MLIVSYYDNFLKASRTPSQEHRDAIQELVNYQFDNSSTYYTDVEEETEFGTLIFKPCQVRVNTIVDAKTGQRVNDDYKKLIFKDLKYNPLLGTRYKFDNNIWITFSTDNIKTDTSSVYVRRCNNTINTQDRYGNIHNEPCYVDYKVTETQPFSETKIDIPKGRIWVQYQHNDWTKNITLNKRLMFGDNTYKIRENHDYDRQETFNNNTMSIASFYADYDEISPYDNKELQIANYIDYNYIINVQDDISGSIGGYNAIKYTVSLNDNIVNEEVIFNSSNENICTVDNFGNVLFVNSGECYITTSLKNNTKFSSNTKIMVTETPVYIYKNIIEPNITNIKLNKTQIYSVFEYYGDIKQETLFDVNCYDAPKNNYLFEFDGNSFAITNLKPTENELLKVVCTNRRTKEDITIYIKLGGLF